MKNGMKNEIRRDEREVSNMVNNQQHTIRTTFSPFKIERLVRFPLFCTPPAPLSKGDREYCLPCYETAVEAVNLRHGQDNDCGAQIRKVSF